MISSSIGLIVASTSNDLGDFVNPVDEQGNIIAPADFNAIISSYGVSANYGTAQRIGVYNDDTTTEVTLTVTGTGNANITNAVLNITSGGKAIGYTNNANGTYTFVVGRGATANVTVSAQGYEDVDVTISATNTANATYATTQALTEAEA